MGICDSVNSKSNINYSNTSFEKEDTSIRKETKVNSTDISNEKIRRNINNHRKSIEKRNQIEKTQVSQSANLKKKRKKKLNNNRQNKQRKKSKNIRI